MLQLNQIKIFGDVTSLIFSPMCLFGDLTITVFGNVTHTLAKPTGHRTMSGVVVVVVVVGLL